MFVEELLTHTLESPVNTGVLAYSNNGFFVSKFIRRNTKLARLFCTFVFGLIVFQQSFLKNIHSSLNANVYKGFGLPRPLFFSINIPLTISFL